MEWFSWHTVALLATVFISAFLLLAVSLRYSTRKYSPSTSGRVSAQVLVLGDIGRSPRMQYHALSIAKHGGDVQLIGYEESSLIPALVDHRNVQVCALVPAPRQRLQSLPFIIAGPIKVIWQVVDLFSVLLYKTQPARWLLVQNPPSIPTLLVAAVVCWARDTRLIIDWHNYGWTILAGTRGGHHPFVRISKLYECAFGRLGSANLTVTHAMKAELQRAPYGIRTPIAAMHDRPADIFRPLGDDDGDTDARRAANLRAIGDATADLADAVVAGRVRLLVSSTSWTPDEDFALLLDALVRYGASPARVPLLVVITGRGPQRAAYEARIARLAAAGRLPDITIRTAFLPFADYARLLAAADLGICLHMSSSGVDLPMKVVDMFGAGLPVLAYSGYPSFAELVKVGQNGAGFENHEELAEGLTRLLDVKTGGRELAVLKAGAIKEGARRWDEEWVEVVKPLLGFP